MGLLSAILQSMGESEGRKNGEGNWAIRAQLGGDPELLSAYNQGISNGIARRIADSVEAANRKNDPDSVGNWLKRQF